MPKSQKREREPKPSQGQVADTPESKAMIKAAYIGAAALIIVFLLGVLYQYLDRSIATPTPFATPIPTSTSVSPTATATFTPTLLPSIQITSPQDQSQVSTLTQVTGKLGAQLCAECKLFIVVHPLRPSSAPYYGQPDTAIVAEDTFSHSKVNIGNVGEQCDQMFEIWAVISHDNLNTGLTKDAWEQVRKDSSSMVTVKKQCP